MTLEEIAEDGYDVGLFTSFHPQLTRENVIRFYFRCPRFYLLHSQGMNHAPLSAIVAQIMFFNKKRRDLFNLKPRFLPYQYSAEGKLPEQMTPEELQKHLAFPSPEAFARNVKNGWNYGIVPHDEYIGRQLRWPFDAAHKLGVDLEIAAHHYYEFILDQGAPIFGLTGYEHIFDFEGMTLAIRFPELRRNKGDALVTLDNIYPYSFNLYSSKSETIEQSPFVTLKLLALTDALRTHRIFRAKCGFPDDVAELLDPRIRFRHVNCLKNEITESLRTEDDIDAVRKLLLRFRERVDTEDFSPNHSHCSDCSASILDMSGRPLCTEIRYGRKSSVPGSYLRKANYHIVVGEDEAGMTLTGAIHVQGKTPKNVNQLVLHYTLEQATQQVLKYPLRVTSLYSSFAFNWGFEQRIFQEADRQLKALARKLSREVIHTVSFDLNFAGKKYMETLLTRLRYQDYTKTYKP